MPAQAVGNISGCKNREESAGILQSSLGGDQYPSDTATIRQTMRSILFDS
jgi:hypothetical protein